MAFDQPYIFCTNNAHKLEEVLRILQHHFQFQTLRQAGFEKEIPEPFYTLEENAHTKAYTVYQQCQIPCFAEDTGLFVDALNGEPGVRSARYAGEPQDPLANIQKLLSALEGHTNRSAYFKTVICLIDQSGTHYFEGKCSGRIAEFPDGREGFGYDPIFIPDGYTVSFASMPPEEKSSISHRKKAFDLFAEFLKTL